MAAKIPTDPKEDPQYLFTTPAEELIYFGENDIEKAANAIAFSRLRNIVKRFGQNLTSDEFETLRMCMENCVNLG